MKLKEIASTDVVTLGPSDSVERAFSLMVDNKFRHLPVVDDAGLVGIVSDRDLLVIVSWIDAWKSMKGEPTQVGRKPVQELMSSPAIALSPDDTVDRAAQLMLDRRFSSVPLEREGQIVGIVTETDILQRFLADDAAPSPDRAWRQAPVAEHMSEAVISASPDDGVANAFRLMREKKIRHLPVIDAGKMVGFISDRDMRRAYGREIVENMTSGDMEPGAMFRTTVDQLMNRGIETIDRLSPLAEAARRMLTGKIGALPVKAEDELVGIISETDLLRAFVNRDQG